MRAIAYLHGPARVHILANSFAQGCARHGVLCEVRRVEDLGGERADVVWLYGLGPARPVFDAHEGALRLVGDKGYFAEYAREKFFRVSVNAQQPDKHLKLREHPSDRFDALRMNVQPIDRRGDYILICGIGPKQCERHGLMYGEWERRTYERLRQVTGRRILVREKPKNPPIAGLPRAGHTLNSEAIRGAWCVVCMTGNIGVDCIVEGVPVIAEGGPGSVYYSHALEEIEAIQPMSPEARIEALSDIAYWQWKPEEIAKGEFWEHLKQEGMV